LVSASRTSLATSARSVLEGPVLEGSVLDEPAPELVDAVGSLLVDMLVDSDVVTASVVGVGVGVTTDVAALVGVVSLLELSSLHAAATSATEAARVRWRGVRWRTLGSWLGGRSGARTRAQGRQNHAIVQDRWRLRSTDPSRRPPLSAQLRLPVADD
jgi:hypothetical protein